MVSQSADDVILGVDGGEIIVPQAGGNVTAEVHMNIPDYTITPEESAQWLKVIKKKHGLKVFGRSVMGQHRQELLLFCVVVSINHGLW